MASLIDLISAVSDKTISESLGREAIAYDVSRSRLVLYDSILIDAIILGQNWPTLAVIQLELERVRARIS